MTEAPSVCGIVALRACFRISLHTSGPIAIDRRHEYSMLVV